MSDNAETVELELFLVRHGQSMGNVGLPAGANDAHGDDPPLTEKGNLQARLLGAYYKDTVFDCVLASGLNRAAQTAAAVVRRQPGAEKQLEIHPLFTECGVGADYGFKSVEELQTEIPFAVPAVGLTAADNMVHTPGPEDDDVRAARAHAALNYIRSRFRSGERVMLVGHGAFNTHFLFAALGLTAAVGFDFGIDNSCVSKLVFYRAGTGPYDADVHLIYHNDHSHLAGVFDRELIDMLK